MILDTHGKITEKIFLLGRRESCVYLLEDDHEYILLGGGAAYIIPDILEQLVSLNIPEEKIKWMIILHAHFDHCGIIPFFRKRWPWAKVAGSERASVLLSTPKIVNSIEQLNRFLISKFNRENEARHLGIEFSSISIDRILRDRDTLSCGNLQLEVLEVPGHSSCSIAVYLPTANALFASDSGGIPFGNHVFTAANSNFDQYLNSLDKMDAYNVDIFLTEHYGARTGSDACMFLKKSKAAAIETRKLLEESYTRTHSIEQSTLEITEWMTQNCPEDFFPKEVISLVVGQMLAYIANTCKPASNTQN